MASMIRLNAVAGPSRVLRSVTAQSCPRTTALRSHAVRYNSSASPSAKVTAVPFALKPEAAAHKMLMNGLIGSARAGNLFYSALLKFFGPGIMPFAKEFGLGESLVMRDMKAVYWPVWRVDAILEGKVRADNGGGKEGAAALVVEEGYIPGNPFAPLSYLSFAVPPLPSDLPTYDSSSSLSQLGDGYEVVPVPFTVSPFQVMETAQQAIGRGANWGGLKIDASRWKATMAAAYPVFFPIYVAEFEHTEAESSRRWTVVMDAHDQDPSKCRASWPPPPEMFEMGRFTSNYYVNPAPFLPDADLLTSTGSAASAGPLQIINAGRSGGPSSGSTDDEGPSKTINELYSTWMSPAPSSKSYIRPSPTLDCTSPAKDGEAVIDWDDVRIQSWNAKSRHDNGEYMVRFKNYHLALGGLERLRSLSESLPEGADPKGMMIQRTPDGRRKVTNNSISDMIGQMEKEAERMRGEAEEHRPSWLKRD